MLFTTGFQLSCSAALLLMVATIFMVRLFFSFLLAFLFLYSVFLNLLYWILPLLISFNKLFSNVLVGNW